MSTIKEKIDEILEDRVGIDRDQVKGDSRFKEDLGLDSLDIVETTMDLELEFDISIPDKDLEDIKTVDDMEKLIKKLTDGV